MIESIQRFLNGDQYQRLTKDEKRQLRDEEYKKILGSYIIIASSFIAFGLIVIIFAVQGIMNISTDSVMFYLIVALELFLMVVTFIMFRQMVKKHKGAADSIKYDIIINYLILSLLTAMTLANIEHDGYLSLYAVGLITFALLVRVKPSEGFFYFIIILLVIFLYIKIYDIKMNSAVSFYINVSALNFIIFFVARMLFIEHIDKYTKQMKIKEQNIELEKLTMNDFLTGVYNRRGFESKIKEPLKYPLAICLFDLDGLKLINDALGHEKGDKAILFTAELIKDVFKDCFCARLGGDEFVVIAEDKDSVQVSESINEFNRRMESGNNLEIDISASVGYEMVYEPEQFLSAYKKAENAMYHLKLGARSSRKNRSMEALMSALYNYTGETERHCHCVGHISQLILSEIGFIRKDDQEAVNISGMLHDIGKLLIPQSILKKEEKLTEEEWDTLKTHSEESYKIACGLIDDKDIVDAILYHHERWDGSGYPYGLKGEEIPIFARVLSVADAYDAMRTDRCYSKKMTHEQACEELVCNKGKQFAPNVVEGLLCIPESKLKY